MLKLLFRTRALFHQFKLTNYTNQDFTTMCGLLQQKYQLHNQEIQTSGLIKLLDQEGRVIGVYTASEARKKAQNLNLDMVMVSMKASPMICKAVDFRKRTLNAFFDQVVLKSQRDKMSKASSMKSIKVAATLNKNEMMVKIKQITELSLKHAKVRVYMSVKQSHKDECLSILQELKSQLLNKCYVENEISNLRYDEDQEDEKTSPNYIDTYSFVVRTRDQDPAKKFVEDKKNDPDTMTINFLKKYYTQEEADMMDLKSAGSFEVDKGEDVEEVPKQTEVQLGFYEQKDEQVDQQVQRQAEARILNKRLKVLLSLTL